MRQVEFTPRSLAPGLSEAAAQIGVGQQTREAFRQRVHLLRMDNVASL